MNIDETSVYVNEKLKEGLSIAKIERSLNFGKDTMRKKLNRAFTYEDFNILFEIIDNHKLKKNTIKVSREDSDVVTRSFRSYKTILDMFSKYCKDNELVQKDAVAMLY